MTFRFQPSASFVVFSIAFSTAWGDAEFDSGSIISTSGDGAVCVFSVDLDGDGDADVLSASNLDDKVAWYENDGLSPPGFTERVISTTADGAFCVFATDVDGDGDADVLSASFYDDTIAWYESDGLMPPGFTQRIVSTDVDGPRTLFAADVNGDGAIDVLSASQYDDTIAWYESDGETPPGFTKRIISTEADVAWSVYAADLDGDGDVDVLSGSVNDSKVAWYESDGLIPPGFTERVISTTAYRANAVVAVDIDGDGDTDVLSASELDDKVAWYENDGLSPPGFTERVISTIADGAFSVFAADVDGDGDTDVLSASFYDDTIAWHESDGLMPPGFTERIISTDADGAWSVYAADVDGDGDTDVLSASVLDDTIAWYEFTQSCEGDANGDGSVDVNDISYVLFRLGDSGIPGEVDGDANGDGVVDVNDISYVLFRLGNACP
jgi:hypothetical protein